MGHATLSADGTYTSPGHAKAVFGTMSRVRASIVANASQVLGKAVVIGVRYCAVRRQFGEDPEQEGQGACPPLRQVPIGGVRRRPSPTPRPASACAERAVLDYPSVQHRVLPWLAGALALHFTGLRMRRMYERHAAHAARGDWSLLSEMHATTSGLKSRCTFLAVDGIECVRRACGGHGYSASAGLSALYADYVGICAAEGENVLLTQQAARYLLKRAAGRGRGTPDPVLGAGYLAETEALLRARCPPACGTEPAAWRDPAVLERALEARAAALAALVGTALQASMQRGAAPLDAWREQLEDVRRLSGAHSELLLFRSFRVGVADAPEAGGVRAALAPLLSLFGCWLAVEGAAEVMQSGYAGAGHVACLRRCLHALLAEVRPQAVPLVDGLGLSDHFLTSTLGALRSLPSLWLGDAWPATS